MLPILNISSIISGYLSSYRDVFYRSEGFDWVQRYLIGLLISPNKTVQGIYNLFVWLDPKYRRSRRAMHASLFESGWDDAALMGQHRHVVSEIYDSSGRQVIVLDWTLGHHLRGSHIFGTKKRFDYVLKNWNLHQILLTATISNRDRVDGLDVIVQEPGYLKAEKAYLKATCQENYDDIQAAGQRLMELLHHYLNRQSYRKRSDLFVESVRQLEDENQFPKADYAFANGVLCPQLARLLGEREKYWLSELEVTRLIWRHNKYQHIQDVAAQLRQQSPQSFKKVTFRKRNGESETNWLFSKCVRLKKFGKVRIFIVHEKEDLSDRPRFLVANALHWEARRALETWDYRWGCEVFHEFGKQCAGLESAQVRNEDAVKKHVRLSCVAQSLLQSVPAKPSTSEKFKFAKGHITCGQKWRALAREVLRSTIDTVKIMIENGKTTNEILDQLMPV